MYEMAVRVLHLLRVSYRPAHEHLGGSIAVTGRLTRATNNALTVSLRTEAGADVGKARQKGSTGVLFGFKNGGQGSYKLVAGEDVLEIAVGPTTTVSRAGWKNFDGFLTTLATWDMAGISQKLSSAGSLLALNAPLDSTLGDLLAAACVDVAVFPKGYIVTNSAAS